MPSNPHSHLLRSPNRRGPSLPGRQEKPRRGSLVLCREMGAHGPPPRPERGRQGGPEGGRERGPGPQPDRTCRAGLGHRLPPARFSALPAGPRALFLPLQHGDPKAGRRCPAPSPAARERQAPGPAAAGAGAGTYPPLAPAGKPRSRENMLHRSAESAPGFPPREPALPRPRHVEGHGLPPGPLRGRGSRPQPSSSSGAGIHRRDRAGTAGPAPGPGTAEGRRRRDGGRGDKGGGGDDLCPSSAVSERFPLELPWMENGLQEGAAAGTAGPGMLLSSLSLRVTQAQRQTGTAEGFSLLQLCCRTRSPGSQYPVRKTSIKAVLHRSPLF